MLFIALSKHSSKSLLAISSFVISLYSEVLIIEGKMFVSLTLTSFKFFSSGISTDFKVLIVFSLVKSSKNCSFSLSFKFP